MKWYPWRRHISAYAEGKWKKKCADVGIGKKQELIEKLVSEVSVVRFCDEYEVKKHTVSDIRQSRDKLTSYTMEVDLAPSKDRKGAVHRRRHMKVPKI